MMLLAICLPLMQEEVPALDVSNLDFGAQLVRMMLVLLGLLTLLIVGLKYLPGWLFGRALERGQAGGQLEVIERRPLDSRASLFLVRVDGKRLLIGRSEAGLERLGELDGGDAARGPSFAERMASHADPEED